MRLVPGTGPRHCIELSLREISFIDHGKIVRSRDAQCNTEESQNKFY